MNYFCSAITEIEDLGDQQPRLPEGITGPGYREQQAGALQGGQSHEEGIKPGVRGGWIQYLITA